MVLRLLHESFKAISMADFKRDSNWPFNIYHCYYLKIVEVMVIIYVIVGGTATNGPSCTYILLKATKTIMVSIEVID